ncbi:hypothetical protein, partial [Acetobacter tropicalis]
MSDHEKNHAARPHACQVNGVQMGQLAATAALVVGFEIAQQVAAYVVLRRSNLSPVWDKSHLCWLRSQWVVRAYHYRHQSKLIWRAEQSVETAIVAIKRSAFRAVLWRCVLSSSGRLCCANTG